jgi:hypothetical protein
METLDNILNIILIILFVVIFIHNKKKLLKNKR